MGFAEWLGLRSNQSILDPLFLRLKEQVERNDKKSAKIVVESMETIVSMKLVGLARFYNERIQQELSSLKSDFKHGSMTNEQILAHMEQVKQKIRAHADEFSWRAQNVLQDKR